MSTRAHRCRIGFTGHIGGLCGFWSAWWPPPASCSALSSASTERSIRARRAVVAAGAVRGAGDRRPLRHLRRPGEPREAERAHDRPPRGCPSCVLEAGPKGRGHVPRRRAGRRRHRAGGRPGLAVERAEPYRDILLVDQRGTGGSNPHGGDVTQYGTRMAMDDLDAVRAALGYRQLDVIGSSYGATAAQVYLKLHPSSVRTLILMGATAIDVPFFDRYAVNAQRALDQLAKLCASQAPLPEGVPRLGAPVRRAREGMERPPGERHDGRRARLHRPCMLLDLRRRSRSRWSSAAQRRATTRPSSKQGPGGLDADLNLMGSSIWCNEPWAGIDATGPWGTEFDSYTTARIAAFRQSCSSVPKRAEPRSLWTLPTTSRVPVLAFAGGADPQDPVSNLSDLKQHFPDSRTVIFPHIGHQCGIGGCLDQIVTDFVDRGTTKGLDTTRCSGAVVVPPFDLPD